MSLVGAILDFSGSMRQALQGHGHRTDGSLQALEQLCEVGEEDLKKQIDLYECLRQLLVQEACQAIAALQISSRWWTMPTHYLQIVPAVDISHPYLTWLSLPVVIYLSQSASVVVHLIIPHREEIVKVVKTVLQEEISERICKQIDDVFVSQVVEQVTGLPKTSSRDRSLQCTAEQIFDVPGPGNGETVGGSAGDRFPGKNPAADCGADR